MTLDNFPATKRALKKQGDVAAGPPEAEGCLSDDKALKLDLAKAQASLRALEDTFDAKLQERLAAELKSDATVHYLRDLELKYKDALERAQQQTKAHADLRIAYLTKIRKKTKKHKNKHRLVVPMMMETTMEATTADDDDA